MPDLYIVATLVAKPEAADVLRSKLLSAVEDFRKEDGCLSYTLLEDEKHVGRFVTYERWRDAEALAKHMSSPKMREMAPQLPELLADEMNQDFLKALLIL